MTRTFAIDGMHCDACVKKVSQSLNNAAGVKNAEVTLNPPLAIIEGDADRDALAKAVADAGDYALGEEITDRVEADATERPAYETASSGASGYGLLAIVVGYILLASVLPFLTIGALEPAWMAWMANFMAAFFLFFSFFKMLDVPGFAASFRMYDLVAGRFRLWSYAYPFVELALGIAYAIRLAPVAVNAITLIVMLVGAAGVLRSLLDKRQIRCACLGTVIDLPLGTVSLTEDLLMGVMAGVMLVALVV